MVEAKFLYLQEHRHEPWVIQLFGSASDQVSHRSSPPNWMLRQSTYRLFSLHLGHGCLPPKSPPAAGRRLCTPVPRQLWQRDLSCYSLAAEEWRPNVEMTEAIFKACLSQTMYWLLSSVTHTPEPNCCLLLITKIHTCIGWRTSFDAAGLWPRLF